MSITVCGANVTRKTAIIITVVGSVGTAVSCLLIIIGFVIGCDVYFNGYYEYTDCSVMSFMVITGGVLLSVAVTVVICGCIMLYRIRRFPMTMPSTFEAPMNYGQPYPQQGVGQPYPQQGVGQLYPQQGTGQPYLQQGAGQFYSEQGTSQPYQKQGVAPTYPQQAGVSPYPQQAGAPTYPQQAGAPTYPQQAGAPTFPQQAGVSPYLQQATAPSYPHQTTGLPHEQGPDQPYTQKSAY
ncbi:calcium-binding protein P-like [Penaeus indicus]|uniref:calcium-binding protein P-like n=1 Tax=Penaeus indicus TaxID=29960 RepID=UPI00300D7B70